MLWFQTIMNQGNQLNYLNYLFTNYYFLRNYCSKSSRVNSKVQTWKMEVFGKIVRLKSVYRKYIPLLFYRIVAFENFAKLTGKHLVGILLSSTVKGMVEEDLR